MLNLATAVEFQAEVARLQAVIESLRQEIRTQRLEIAGLREERRAAASVIERLSLSDEERAVIEVCATHFRTFPASQVMRRLLERHGDKQ